MRLPTGPSVTFLFTDIEGSTRHERAAGSTAWASLIARHDRLLREAIERSGGVVVKTEGDAFFAAFAAPLDAIRAAIRAQHALAAEAWGPTPIRVRMGLHVGDGRLRDLGAGTDVEDYVGIDVNYAARVAGTANGGQVVLSDALASAVRPALGADGELLGVELVDEGLRIVKDFDEPARLHRLVVPDAADDPRPLRTLDPPSNLPGDVTALVGREVEIALAREALLSSRVVTLTGPGGSGKTRLALGVARSVADRFPHGTWFVDLASLRDPAMIETTIATAIGVRESRDAAVGEALRAMLRDRSLLLVLDNVEQLLPGAADIISALVRAAPELWVLATSRGLLRIAGEHGYPVPPLDTAAGVILFEERARAHRPDLAFPPEIEATIRAICHRVGGLPLAIELAAARVRTMTPAMILDRLGRSLDLATTARDLPERQRTLRGAIDWSHDLLTEPERRLFRRLGVFAGGWTIRMAEAVVDADRDLGVDLVDGLESLADKSLIRIEPPSDEKIETNADAIAGTVEEEVRFSLHPLLREYALERLAATGEQTLLEARHADAMTGLAEELGPGINGPRAVAVLRRLDLEAYNLRAALDWSIDNDVPDLGLRLAGAVWRWYHQRNHLREGRAILAELLARTPHGDPLVRIAGLAAQGGLAYWMSDAEMAETAYAERLELAEATGDQRLLGDAHYDIGFISMLRMDGATLRRHDPGPAGARSRSLPRGRLRSRPRSRGAEPARVPGDELAERDCGQPHLPDRGPHAAGPAGDRLGAVPRGAAHVRRAEQRVGARKEPRDDGDPALPVRRSGAGDADRGRGLRAGSRPRRDDGARDGAPPARSPRAGGRAAGGRSRGGAPRGRCRDAVGRGDRRPPRQPSATRRPGDERHGGSGRRLTHR
jgi:predicted ATPase/class 3 adenylate cyclase